MKWKPASPPRTGSVALAATYQVVLWQFFSLFAAAGLLAPALVGSVRPGDTPLSLAVQVTATVNVEYAILNS